MQKQVRPRQTTIQVTYFLPFSGEWRRWKARARGEQWVSRTQDEDRVCLVFFFSLLLFTVYITELSRGRSVAYQFQQIMNTLER